MNEDLAKARQELDNQQAERTRISRLETEINEKLVDVHNKLLQAGVDQKESEREVRLKETLQSLQRIFPGVRGRVVDLCKPTQRKYETAVSVVLGRNIDAVVVDEEKTAIDCIEVSMFSSIFETNADSMDISVHAQSTCRPSDFHSPRYHPGQTHQ